MYALETKLKLHLSLWKNLLLVQFEGSANLSSHSGRLLTWIQGIFFRELSCQFLRTTTTTTTKTTTEILSLEGKTKTYCLILVFIFTKSVFIIHTASLMQMLLSSSSLCLRVSSSASCLALSAASMSFLAVWELSDSWEPASYRQHTAWGQTSGVYEQLHVGLFGVVGTYFESDWDEELWLMRAPASLAGCLQGSEGNISIRKLSLLFVWAFQGRSRLGQNPWRTTSEAMS